MPRSLLQLDRQRRIEWLDYNDPQILQRAAPRTREEMANEMHTRTTAGSWSKGYFAWIEVIRVLPRWKWLAPIMALWPFRKLGPIFYGWLAARRYTLFGVPPPCDASGVPVSYITERLRRAGSDSDPENRRRYHSRSGTREHRAEATTLVKCCRAEDSTAPRLYFRGDSCMIPA